MYKVIKNFTDLQDNAHEYKVGDAYPRDGAGVTPGRIAQLSGSLNRQGTPLIAEEKGNSKAESLDSAITPVQPEEAGQGTLLKEEKPKRGRKSKEK